MTLTRWIPITAMCAWVFACSPPDAERRPTLDEAQAFLERVHVAPTVSAELGLELTAVALDTWTSSDPRRWVTVLLTHPGADAPLPEDARRYGRAVVTRANLRELDALLHAPGVLSIHPPTPMLPMLDDSTELIGLSGSAEDFDGEGVVIGVVDSGINLQHPDFWLDGQSRVLALWDQDGVLATNRTPQIGHPPTQLYGQECSQAEITAEACGAVDDDPDGHGTHVAGIAAGNGNRDAGKTGVAPGASLVIVDFGGNQPDEGPVPQEAELLPLGTDIAFAHAVDYIRSRAGAQPVVVNYSQGWYLGPHDGCAASDEIANGLVAQGVPLVVAAGNAGTLPIDAALPLTAGAPYQATLRVAGTQWASVDLWGVSGDAFTVTVVQPDGTTSEAFPAATTNGLFTFPDGAVVRLWDVDEAVTCPGSRRHHTLLRLEHGTANLQPGDWTIRLDAATTLPGGGVFHAWVEPRRSVSLFGTGRAPTSIATPASASDVITVGNFVSWDPFAYGWSICPGADPGGDVGDLASGSSRGGLLGTNPPEKPDLSAPGAVIRSALNTYDGGFFDRAYHCLSGTSMAAPHVAGAVALLLQKNGALDPSSLKRALVQNADGSGLILGSDSGWGAGRLDVSAALDAVPAQSGPAAGLVCEATTPLMAAGTANVSLSNGRLVVRVVDAQGVTVSTSAPISAAVTAGATSLGVVSSPIPATRGQAVFALAATATPGLATLTASGPGGATCTAEISVLGASGPTAVSSVGQGIVTWSLAQSPIVISSDLVIPAGATVVIEPGVVIQLAQEVDLYVQGALRAVGTADRPITFTAVTQVPGTWGGIVLQGVDPQASRLEHVRLRYGGRTSYAEDHPIVMAASQRPQLAHLDLQDNRTNIVAIVGGTYDEPLTFSARDVPLVLLGDLVIGSHGSLELLPGVTLFLLDEVDVYVRGRLIADGSASAPITLTSVHEDGPLGDLLGDGPTSGTPGSWGGLVFESGSRADASRLHHLVLRYAGQNSYAEDFPIVVTPTSVPTVGALTLQHCLPNAVGLRVETLTTTVRLPALPVPYQPTGDLTVGPEGSLILDPGVVFKPPYEWDLHVYGALVAEGTEARPVRITSWRDDGVLGDTAGDGATTGVAGDWGGIRFYPGRREGRLSRVILSFGGQNSYAVGYPLVATVDALPTLDRVQVTHSAPAAVGILGGSLASDATIPTIGALPYWLAADLTVEASAQLTIAPGVHIRVPDDVDLRVFGDLVVDAPDEDPVVFTSSEDTTYGGELFGAPTSPSPGDWGGIRLYGSVDREASLLRGLQLLYGGGGGYGEQYALTFDDAEVRVEHCLIANSHGGVLTVGARAPDLGGGALQSLGHNQFRGFVPGGTWALRHQVAADLPAANNAWGIAPGLEDQIIEDRLDVPSVGRVQRGTAWTRCTPGATQACGTATGACGTGTTTCASDGQWLPCQGAVTALVEACNGVDDDCDGLVDEAVTEPCGLAAGACATGHRICAAGVWSDCSGATWPAPETCDGVDQDCDGRVDEALVRTCGVDTGACVSGQSTCHDGGWAACEGDVAPHPEACNGGDDDCDAQTDEGEVCLASGPTSVSGTLQSATTWSPEGSPYLLTHDVVVPAGVTLQILPGTQILAASEVDLYVSGVLRADGTPEDRIVFEGLAGRPGTWGGVQLQSVDDSLSSLRHVTFRHGGQTSYAIDKPLLLGVSRQPVIEDVLFEDNRINGLSLPGGTWSHDLHLRAVGVPYLIEHDVTISGAGVVHLHPGVVLKLAGEVDIYVDGGLQALGTPAEPIVLTSWWDDSVLGDSDGRGPTSGAPGDWGGIEVHGHALPGLTGLDHVRLRYAGGDSYAVNAPLLVHGSARPALGEIEIVDSVPNAVQLTTGTYTTDVYLDPIPGLAWWIPSDLVIAEEASLHIAPGTVLKLGDEVDLYVDGVVNAEGTASEPIHVTTWFDDRFGGDTDGAGPSSDTAGQWGGFFFRTQTSAASRMRHVHLHHGGQDSYAENAPVVVHGNAVPDLGALVFDDCSPNAIGLVGQTYGVDVHLTDLGAPYYPLGDVSIEASADLWIDPGVILRMEPNTDMRADGGVTIDGSSRPIVFTSWRDDGWGGDADNGGNSDGVVGDWGGLELSSTRDGLLRAVHLYSAGQGGVGNLSHALSLDDAQVRIEQSVVGWSNDGVWTTGGPPDLGGGGLGSAGANRFLGFGDGANGYAIEADDGTDVPAMGNQWDMLASQIDDGIFDALDDPTRGRVLHEPVWEECAPGQVSSCGTSTGPCGAGLRTCDAFGRWGACAGAIVAAAETCNGVDDDCDGTVDDGLVEACGTDRGACETGLSVCTLGAWGPCLAQLGPTTELCNNADDDCDGLVDETVVRTCGTDVGACSTGTQRCSLGSWGTCQDDQGPAGEVCNAADDDCDGVSDEGGACLGAGPTLLCGTLSGADLHWTPAGAPYWLTCDVHVPAGATLVIDPGTQIEPNPEVDLWVDGAVHAVGTANAPIVFSSPWGVPGAWGGIEFAHGADGAGSVLSHVILRHGAGISYALDHVLRIVSNDAPSLSHLTLEDNLRNGVHVVRGSGSGHALLDPAIPYYFTSDFVVDAGHTFTLGAGVVLKLGEEVDLYVYGDLLAEGTPSQPILLTSLTDDAALGSTDGLHDSVASPGAWGGVLFDSLSRGSRLSDVEVRYGGGDSYAENAPLVMHPYADVQVRRVRLVDCAPNAVRLITGSFSGGATLEAVDGLPYWVGSDLTIAAGSTWTIEPGTVFRMGSEADLHVLGNLSAVGTADAPIVFTGFTDDRHGGVIEGRTARRGTPDAWGGVAFNATTNPATSRLRQVVLAYGGGNSYAEDYPVRVDWHAVPSVDQITLEHNSPNAIGLVGATLSGSRTVPRLGAPYRVDGDLTVGPAAVLTLAPGTTFLMGYDADLRVEGGLVADGTTAPITFTSWRDGSAGGAASGTAPTDGVAGDWGGLHLSSPTYTSLLRGVRLAYGGAGGVGNSDYLLNVEGASVLVERSVLGPALDAFHGEGAGVDLGGGALGSVGQNTFVGFPNGTWAAVVGGPVDIQARNNDWGTASTSVLEAMIHDRLDDGARGRLVYAGYTACADGAVRACGTGIGACATGSQVCTGGGWGACLGSVDGTVESCNGVDDDCDGVVDEAVLSPPCPRQEGVCLGALQTCGGSAGWLPCGTDAYGVDWLPFEDDGACDALDNDCDGVADEACDGLTDTDPWCEPAVAGPLLTEVLPNPPGSDVGAEWVEVHNPTCSPISLAGWRLAWGFAPGAEGYSDPLPAGATLAPGAFLVIATGQRSGVPGAVALGGWTLGDGVDTDYVRLVDDHGTPRDAVLYGGPNVDAWRDDGCVGVGAWALAPTEGSSLARRADGRDTNHPSDWLVGAPTPRAPGSPPTLTIAPSPLQWGAQGTWDVQGLQPGDRAYLLLSTQGTSGQPQTLCPAALPACVVVSLLNPTLLRSETASAAGTARFQLRLPANTSPRTAWFQVVGTRSRDGACGWNTPAQAVLVTP